VSGGGGGSVRDLKSQAWRGTGTGVLADGRVAGGCRESGGTGSEGGGGGGDSREGSKETG
jgi:hypothetical protein